MLSVQTASFSRTPQGEVCITFDDAIFARADVVFIDPSSRQISALLDGLHFKIGTVTEDMAGHFMANDSVILTAPHPQGHLLALIAPVETLH